MLCVCEHIRLELVPIRAVVNLMDLVRKKYGLTRLRGCCVSTGGNVSSERRNA